MSKETMNVKEVKKTCKNCGKKTCWASGCMDWNANEECWVKKEMKEIKSDGS